MYDVLEWSVINRLHGKNAYVDCLFSIDKSFQNWVIDKYSTPNGIRISKIKSAVLSRFPGARF